jgi:ribonuclease D
MTNFTYIDTQQDLEKASIEWNTDLGIDLECENNLHHYGSYISIFQISNSRNWIVDVISLKDIKPVIEMLQNPKLQKVFHGISFDLRIIHHQFNCRPKNIFDTQIAALLLGKNEVGLGPLLEEYFGVKKELRQAVADWTIRPLTERMLEYATKDTAYLLKLRNILQKELVQKGRLAWAKEEFLAAENAELEYKEGGFWDIKGLRLLTDNQRAVLKELYDLRERLAQQVNRPIHFIISTKRLYEIAAGRPLRLDEWRNMKAVHPVLRARAHQFYQAVNEGSTKELKMLKRKGQHTTNEQRDKIKELTEKRNAVADRLGIQGYVILGKEQVEQIILNKDISSLRNWQNELMKDIIAEFL